MRRSLPSLYIVLIVALIGCSMTAPPARYYVAPYEPPTRQRGIPVADYGSIPAEPTRYDGIPVAPLRFDDIPVEPARFDRAPAAAERPRPAPQAQNRYVGIFAQPLEKAE